ncbi:MAG: pseudaminic acid synthase [Brevundimonas sp.]|uniref:pseudaminic acid synthase n=1 Tax=Brevundimonas sp. TaxID=1871086 RepID=UPI002489CD5F|nr:pseudaminic acid synthase [Brevundimonas sp.]MDI1325516.1 pseudaminic acid synthase [Brevundimonas sp.]
MSESFSIGSRQVGRGHKPYLIAEMSGNHNHSLDRALEIVSAAAASGADAIKLQTYTAATMTLDLDTPGFVIDDPASPWNGRSLYDLYEEAHTPWDWHAPIMEHARSLGLHCFSSPFDSTAVDFLETLDVPAYKIASFELVDIPLIERVAATGKPVIMSTGMATVAEIGEAVMAARRAGAQNTILLKCTSTYPAEPLNTNLATIPTIRETFGCEVGLSDHTMGTGVAVASIALGAPLIEKHFTLARADGGVDSAFSLEPAEFRALREECDRAWQAIGTVTFGGTKAEEGSRLFRRSLYIAQDMKAGDVLTAENLRAIRPGYGLPPKYIDHLLGRRVLRDVVRGTPASWDLFVPAR